MLRADPYEERFPAAMSIPAMITTLPAKLPSPTAKSATLKRTATTPRTENPWMDRLREADSLGLDALLVHAAELKAMQFAKAQEQWTEYQLWTGHEGEFLGVISPAGEYRRVTRCYNWPCWACSGSPFWSVISATNSALMRYARTTPEREAEILKALVNPKHAYIAKALIKRHNRQSAALLAEIGAQA